MSLNLPLRGGANESGVPSKRRPKLVPKMTLFNTKLTNVSIAYDVFHIRAGLVLVELSIAIAWPTRRRC